MYRVTRGTHGGRRMRGAISKRVYRSLGAITAFVGLTTIGVGGVASASTQSPVSVNSAAASLLTHPYRHGVVPMLGQTALQLPACSTKCVVYGGGIDSVGVSTGQEKVYLIFAGSQWGTESTNSSGYKTFSGDPVGMAPDLQAFFSGLGSSTDTWSGTMTTYCQGVSKGAAFCPTSAAHVAYPTGGALAGVWEDTAKASPAQSTAHEIAMEAVRAAKHFGNTTLAANRNAQYVIVSPHGTNPDNYKNAGFCAWHDYTRDTTLDGGGAVGGPPVAFTNLPYLTDVGSSCGAGFVNPGNVLDGVTIVEGHEYAETVTDMAPVYGWISRSGEEVGDLCAWITTGSGKAQNITLSTGSFAVQSVWANVANNNTGGCIIGHATVS